MQSITLFAEIDYHQKEIQLCLIDKMRWSCCTEESASENVFVRGALNLATIQPICHGKGDAAEDTMVRMNCSSCHEIPQEHPIKKLVK